MAELPGNIHEKIGDLRIERGLTKKQVSEDIGIPASQLTRIEEVQKFCEIYSSLIENLRAREIKKK